MDVKGNNPQALQTIYTLPKKSAGKKTQPSRERKVAKKSLTKPSKKSRALSRIQNFTGGLAPTVVKPRKKKLTAAQKKENIRKRRKKYQKKRRERCAELIRKYGINAGKVTV